jgi:hypothetical protein
VDAILRQEDDSDAASWTSHLSPSDVRVIDS